MVALFRQLLAKIFRANYLLEKEAPPEIPGGALFRCKGALRFYATRYFTCFYYP